jgi:hypothetical protein
VLKACGLGVSKAAGLAGLLLMPCFTLMLLCFVTPTATAIGYEEALGLAILIFQRQHLLQHGRNSSAESLTQSRMAPRVH